MAAPLYVSASTGTTDAGGAWTATGDTGTSGDVVILQVFQDGASLSAVTLDSATNIQNLAGTDNAWTHIASLPVGSVIIQHLWIGRRINTSAPTATGSNSTSEDLYWRFYTFTGVNTGTTLADVIEQNGGTTPSSTQSAGNTTVTDADVTTTGPLRLVLNFLGLGDDNVASAFTGQTGGFWAEQIQEYAEASGTDATIQLQVAYRVGTSQVYLGSDYASGTTAFTQWAQSFTATADVTGVMIPCYKQGSPSDSLVVSIETDSSGEPSGTVLGSYAIPGSVLTATRTWYSLPITASIIASFRYWVRIQRSGSLDDGTCYFTTAGDDNYGYYAGENAKYHNGSNWVTAFDSLAFVIEPAGATIGGGSFTQADSDPWSVIGFALIGTGATPLGQSKSLSPFPPLRHHLVYR